MSYSVPYVKPLSAGSPLLMQATGNAAQLTAGVPVLLDTIPYTAFPSGTTTITHTLNGVLHRNARQRTFVWAYTFPTNPNNTVLFLYDTVFGAPSFEHNVTTIPANGSAGGGLITSGLSSQEAGGLGHALDSLSYTVSFASTNTPPSLGNSYLYVVEVF